jgi:hypothetical protein
MTPSARGLGFGPCLKYAGLRGTAGIATVALLAGLGLAGCGISQAVGAVKKVTHDVAANKATVDQFTTRLKATAGTAFKVTYVTTGKSPIRIIYAVRPPHGLTFRERSAVRGADPAGNVDIVANSSGEYSCAPPSAPGARPVCQKLGKASAAVRNKLFGFYTASHWAVFLREFSLAAGFAGGKVTSSNLTVNGFRMRCVNFRAKGIKGTSRICTTAQGILGYVKVASTPTSFEITSYSPSPPASLFRLPPRARVTRPNKSGG